MPKVQPTNGQATPVASDAVKQAAEAAAVHATNEFFEINSKAPWFTFKDQWPQIISHSDFEELSDDAVTMAGTLAVVCALIFSITLNFGGRDLQESASSLWGPHVRAAQHAYTFLLAVDSAVCFGCVVVTSRLIMTLVLIPKKLAKGSVAAIGGVVIMEGIYVTFFIMCILTLLLIVLSTTIMLPRLWGIASVAIVGAIAVGSIAALMSIDRTMERILHTYERNYNAELAKTS
jgi:hypothetical protein